MADYEKMIRAHESALNGLHQQVKDTWRLRDRSEQAWRDWGCAAERFRHHRSDVDELIDQCLQYGIEDSDDLRRFTFSYVKVDPYFHRSGYVLERLVRKIKRVELCDDEKMLLRSLILNRIDTKALRNFRDICRMIPRIETIGFSNEVARRLRSDDPSIRYRAVFVAERLPILGKVMGVGFEMR